MRLRKRWILLAAYLALLAASYLFRGLEPDPEPPPDRGTAVVAAVGPDGARGAAEVDIAFRRWAPDNSTDTATSAIVLLHGSPGSSGDFAGLGPALAQRRLVVAPDLPGFGHSSRSVPSYSIRAHAEYVRQLLDQLGVRSYDVVGFSMGGGVALHLAELDPGRVRSLTLLSAIGVQELELLGSYELNHSIHAIQLAGLWTLHNAVPHFGALDNSMLSLPYARNFYDTDQRPLRAILDALAAPTLILHGREDPLVPVEAAIEHHRIVPHSEMVLFDGSHFMVFRRPGELVEPLTAFLDAVDSGQARTRGAADPARLEAAARPFDDTARRPASGFSLIVAMLLLAAATLVSEDLACIAAGLMVAQGAIGFLPATAACLFGIFVGDIGLYWSGRLIGHRALSMPPISWVLSEARVAESAAWFERRGALVILLTRFIPGTRLPTYFTAGLLKTNFLRFTVFFLIASTLWTPLLVGVASLVGQRVFHYFEVFSRHALLGAALTVLIIWSLLKLVPIVSTWRGRRLASGFIRRWTRWEFWPWWMLYLPVFGWVVWLGFRFRGPTLFTLANPGIDCGGFAGESKGDLLAQMPSDVLPVWERLAAELSPMERWVRLDAFLEREDVALPVVLKPDAGERGLDVQVIRRLADAQTYFFEHSAATLIQDYVPGLEFGIFYVRRPGDDAGRVTSITAKILPALTGDGESTLEKLILSDERTVCQAPRFLADLGAEGRLEDVPPAGEVVRLGDLGTHWRGATFLDANHLWTAELEATIDHIARAVDGFFFGRFDVRVASEEDLRAGRGIRVLELNGVTSEEAHMYDPRHGVLYAWRTLGAQWETAFEIGALNRGLGLEPAGVGKLFLTWRRSASSRDS